MDERVESCLVTKLSHYVALDDEAEMHLRALEKTTRYYGAKTEIYAVGDTVRDLHVLKHGWVYAHADLPDGRRQIVKIYHPGDIIGFPDIGFEKATVTLHTAEEACLCPFPKTGLNAIFQGSALLTALLFSLSIRDHAIFIDMMRAMGRMSAREKVAYLMMDLISRLRITNKTMVDTIRLPLTQTELGDILGLTNVHISKTMSQLEKDGYITRADGSVKFHRLDDLATMCDFVDRYSFIDTSWFPGARRSDCVPGTQ